jgi:hypothetical protein
LPDEKLERTLGGAEIVDVVLSGGEILSFIST